MRSLLAALAVMLTLPACWSTAARAPRWSRGEAVLQGQAGFRGYEVLQRESTPGGTITKADSGTAMPTVGAAMQWNLADGEAALGAELGLAAAGTWGVLAVLDPDAAAEDVELDVVLIDLSGGPMASLYVGDSVRLYGAVGPLIQFGDYSELNLSSNTPTSGAGFGLGWYARAGVETRITRGLLAGLGVRTSDATVDLSGDAGDLDLRGTDVYITLTLVN